MRSIFHIMSAAFTAVALSGAIGITSVAIAGDTQIENGKKLAFNKKKGNCLACHLIKGGKQTGNIAPPLLGMKGRFPDKAKLKAQIENPLAANPNSMMPPFKAHGILTDKEIDSIVEFIHSL